MGKQSVREILEVHDVLHKHSTLGTRRMSWRRILAVSVAASIVAALSFYGYERWPGSKESRFNELLAQMPSDANVVIYVDLDKLRQSPFLGELYKWAPQPTVDPDYAQFTRATGFNYETDLSRVSIAVLKHGANLFAIAQGRFDRKKISAYAAQSATRDNRGGREIFSFAPSSSSSQIVFTFLSNDKLAFTNGTDLQAILSQTRSDSDTRDWSERFRRLEGSPMFVVVHPDGSAGSSIVPKDSSSLRSSQLSALMDQLQWITFAGKPTGEHLRIVCEGESTAEATTRQLSDALNGLLMLAQAGLSGPKVRQQLQPDVREAYLEMLKSADVTRIDRGETKSVRLVFDLTPRFLEAARNGNALVPGVPKNKPLSNKGTIRN